MPTLDKGNVENIFDLTPLQEGLLFHYLKHNNNSHQNFEQICLNIEGKVNKDVFTVSWAEVVAHNEMLRTVFRWKKLNKPVQITLREHQPRIVYYDITGHAVDHREHEYQQIKVKDRSELFDLEEVPFRVTLVKRSEDFFTIIISNHSIIYDGWSNGILLKEFFETYTSRLDNQSHQLQQKGNFKDFVKVVRGPEPVGTKEFWHQYLSGLAEKNDLLIKSDSACELLDAAGYSAHLSAHQVDEINTFCTRHKLTKATLYYASWGILLQKLSNSKDLVFGTTVSGRSARIEGIDTMVGLLINTLPLRVKDNGQTSMELLQEISAHLLERERYENTSLLKVKEYGALPLNEEVFNTIVLIENYPLDKAVFTRHPECRLTSFTFDQTNNFDIALSILNFEDDIEIFFGYNSGKYSEDIIKSLANYFIKIAGDIVSDPERRVREIELPAPEEKKEILQQFNDTKSAYSSDKFIHNLFEHQASINPGNIALICGDQQLTYQELNRKANQVAVILRRHFGNKKVLVPVVMERSAEMIIALLGIFKAGYGYVPFEPSLPEARIGKLLRSLAVTAVFTDNITSSHVLSIVEEVKTIDQVFGLKNSLKPNLMLSDEIKWIDVDADETFEYNSAGRSNEELAYVIYTSGSTGLPKGVAVSHKPVINVIEWVNKTLKVTPQDKLLFVTSLGFDLSVYDIFGSLAAGAAVYVATREDISDPQLLLNIIIEEKITIWDSAPAAFNQVVQVGSILDKNTNGNRLRMAMLSGDWIGLQLPDMAKNLFGNTEVVSLGGATEAVIWSNYFTFEKVEKNWRSIPYGKPIQNASYYILDDDLNVLPKGVIGELYIGGQCLAQGYINEPDLTGSKFLKSPFTEGERIYKTGDLARWFDDGNIELIGRKDHQVKIRGFRVELGEIETRLAEHPRIGNISILVNKNRAGENFIAAFYVTNGEIDPQELRNHLSHDLPEYMIPSKFIKVDEIPVTANGKVDRKQLLKMIDEEEGFQASVSPETATEIVLAGLWADIIKIDTEKIKTGSNFFDIGGHSLTAAILQARIEKNFDIQVQLREIYANATLWQLARCIDRCTIKAYKIKPVKPQACYPVTSGQKRLYSLQRLNPDSTQYNVVGCVKITGSLDLKELNRVMEDIIYAHESLRTSFTFVEDSLVQIISAEQAFTLQRHKFEGNPEAIDFGNYVHAFDLSEAPLFRLSLIETQDPAVSYLLLDMDHIISDGLSVHKFITDFINGFAGEKITKPEIQFKDYASWTRESAYGDKVKHQEAYWLEIFHSGVNRLTLPLDFERPSRQSHAGDHLTFNLSEEKVDKIDQIVKATDSTLFIVVFSVFNVLLSKICNTSDVTVGVPVANRPHQDLEKIIGFFVNTLPLRNTVSGEVSFHHFVKQVQSNTLKAFENQDYPFEDLVARIEPNRDPRHNPIFDVAMEFDNVDLPDLTLPGVKVEAMPKVLKRAHFDLVLSVLPVNNQITFTFEYCTDLFERSTIEWMKDCLLKLFTLVADDAKINLAEIDLFEQERSQVDDMIQFEF